MNFITYTVMTRFPFTLWCNSLPWYSGWALREETEEKTCPAVIFLHDGPQQAFGEVYHFGMQLLAQNGYVVLFANLPGSMAMAKIFPCWTDTWETMTATVLSVSWTLLWMPATLQTLSSAYPSP